MYTEQQLVAFGNHLLRHYSVLVHSTDGKNTPLHQREVNDADIKNWEHDNPQPTMERTKLPSAHQVDDPVWLCLWSHHIACEIHGVRFFDDKVNYDLRVFGDDGAVTRIYKVDSAFISKTKPE